MIRRAQLDDAPALLALVAALNRDQGDPHDLLTEAQLRDDIIAHTTTIAMVAEVQGALVGYATAHPTYETGHA
ncbi:MAG: GNAT family N-acetyltransferase, partial [Alphaproteobacteria bacterium]